MLLRSCVISAVLASSAAMGCGPVYTEVEFEPLSEAGAVSSAGTAGSGGGGAAAAGAGQAGSGAMGGSAGASVAGMASGAAAMAMGGNGGDRGVSDGGGAGMGGAETNSCAALVDWQLGPYQLGQRVLSTCLLPYNGACPVNETHEFECQPPTGAVGLGWCTDRQPGVVNGWNEAWVMHGVCPTALD